MIAVPLLSVCVDVEAQRNLVKEASVLIRKKTILFFVFLQQCWLAIWYFLVNCLCSNFCFLKKKKKPQKLFSDTYCKDDLSSASTLQVIKVEWVPHMLGMPWSSVLCLVRLSNLQKREIGACGRNWCTATDLEGFAFWRDLGLGSPQWMLHPWGVQGSHLL